MRQIVAMVIFLGMSSICWGKTYYASCHLCDPTNSTPGGDAEVITILNRYASIVGPLDKVSIAQDTPDQYGTYFYVTWSFKQTTVNGQSAKVWTAVSSGQAPTAFNGNGGSGSGGGPGHPMGMGIVTVGYSWSFSCYLGTQAIDCDTGDPV